MSFIHRNEGFACENCGKAVPPRSRSCRNHCPYCLVSKHVDVDPGDRNSDCQGLMDPTGYEVSGKKGLVILFRCRRCGAQLKNLAALDDENAPDSYEKILSLSK